MRRLFRRLFDDSRSIESKILAINRRREELNKLSDEALREVSERSDELTEIFASTAAVAARLLGLEMFDVQIQGALALADGRIAEMQTGEGKTLAAVPAVIMRAKEKKGVHVMTVNDYLARRDAEWMGVVYKAFGLSVGCVQQGMSLEERKSAYAADVTYATANEIGFDHLRDQIALDPEQQAHRPFAAAVIDEADSILIDEARIPLVIAGGRADEEPPALRADAVMRNLRRGLHYELDENALNVALNDDGVAAVEQALGLDNLFGEDCFSLLAAVQNALEAYALLRRDVDYLVRDGMIESIDEVKGRVVKNRRWPSGLQTALEAKEGLALRPSGRILGSVTMQNLVALYPNVCGMTGTAAAQKEEFQSVYGLEVEVIPTNRPVVRIDHPDIVFETKREKEDAVVEEIRRTHASGRPVLVGTASVEESERLSEALSGIPHEVLNARRDDQEAAVIARAGACGAVTISTNMAGRGTDIRLGEGAAELGGLYVIGTNKHESRRIDNQLRGRAGRQGDPGSSRFFVSLEDDLIAKYAGEGPVEEPDLESLQRRVEGQHLDMRTRLWKYEGAIEGQRLLIGGRRQKVLSGDVPSSSEAERTAKLIAIDELWSQYLAEVADLRGGSHWLSLGGKNPLRSYLTEVHELFEQIQSRIDEIEQGVSVEIADAPRDGAIGRGATWTYLANDEPVGGRAQRIGRGLVRKLERRSLWG